MHRFALLGKSRVDNPVHTQKGFALLTHLARHLIVGATNTARADLHLGRSIAHSLLKHPGWLAFSLSLNNIKSSVHYVARNTLFSPLHNIVNKFANNRCLVF